MCLWCAALFFVFTMRCFCNKSVRFCANEFPGFFFLAAVSQKLPAPCSLDPARGLSFPPPLCIGR